MRPTQPPALTEPNRSSARTREPITHPNFLEATPKRDAQSLLRYALATLAIVIARAPAFAWDSVTHREITYLAIRALPPSTLKDLFLHNARQLQYFAVQPDVIRAKYGDESEKIRHYIDL